MTTNWLALAAHITVVDRKTLRSALEETPPGDDLTPKEEDRCKTLSIEDAREMGGYDSSDRDGSGSWSGSPARFSS